MIPLLLGAAALVIGGKGVKKTVSAVSKMNDAKDMAHRYERRSKRAEEKREKAREQAGTAIGQLGETKMNILTGSLQTFVKEFRRIKNVDFRNSVGLEELRDFRPDSPALKEIAAASQKALEFSTGAVEGGLAGGAMALGAYGAVGALATASTGTAIAGLSGAAATNATLAWLGGGSLAAGGLGIAGGTAVLGGIVAAPALLVAGIFLENKADEAMDQARAYREEVREFEERCDSNIALMDAIRTRGDQIRSLLDTLEGHFAASLEQLQAVLRHSGTDWRKYTPEEKQQVGKAALLAKTLKIVLDTPLLREDGTLTPESEKMLAQGLDHVSLQ
ncbi:hypothetical protein [Acidaminococcus fermentans]|jgi:hypothetical protein|uniref:hypothetical protein n=1 Tax=Acidaminococcus fermentans TaxID=905 RepID=UPI00258A6858|nr:hypothetical protein [Acidaminococcus fermentans]MEE1598059.1 hypothetical protein [Acidaminococcus fermentans]MEE4122321.1 hypothetical protein [Acidaminococcus fermentans]